MARRDFLKTVARSSAGAALSRALSEPVDILRAEMAPHQAVAPHPVATPYASHVRPLIGTGWHGHTFPGATAPFGLVQLSPDTSGPQQAWYEWDHSAGYHYRDSVVDGFSHTHIQGTGAPEFGDVLLMPVVDGRNWAWDRGTPGKGYCSSFSHQREVVRAGYYSVHLETPGVNAELTATTRCGMHRYTWPETTGAASVLCGVLLDLAHGLGCKVYFAELNLEGPTVISGRRYTHGWAPDKQVHFVIEFSPPSDLVEIMVDGKPAAPGTRQVSGTEIKARFTFTPRHSSQRILPLLVRVGISGASIEGARKNLIKEIPHWDFDRVRQETEVRWDQALSALDATLPDEASTQVFYTGAYHSLTTPATFDDVDGVYRGEDRQNHTQTGSTKYSSISTWDICRSEFPLLTLMQAERVNDLIKTLLTDYRELNQHSLPYFPLWANETWSRTGFHVVGLILGAYTRGLRSFDVESAYAAMRETAMEGATENGNRALQQQFREYGYVPTGPRKESVFYTLDFAYDYWCVGAMAQLLGRQEDATYFYKLGQNYRNLFDPKTGFMRGKTVEGKWREPFRPDQEYWDDYTESDAWQATFTVMHDVQGLIQLFGGDEAFVAKLDALFAAPSLVYHAPPDVTGLIGQDAQGNEPSNHIPYLYAFAGAAWKTQYWVRRVMAKWYTNTPRGIPGNDDCGQLSSWFVLSALGLYPVNAATGVYVIGSPTVQRARIRNPEAGTTFTIVAENNSPENVYIQSAQFNGKTHTQAWLRHRDIEADGELILRMGPKPNKEWAAALADRPPSGLT
jgi:predicted alpha-1,2-mannosidase